MNKILFKFSFSYRNDWDSHWYFPRCLHDSQTKGPRGRSAFFELQEKLFKFKTCHFKIMARNIKATFREIFSSLRFDSGKTFNIIIFTPRSRTAYCIVSRKGVADRADSYTSITCCKVKFCKSRWKNLWHSVL